MHDDGDVDVNQDDSKNDDDVDRINDGSDIDNSNASCAEWNDRQDTEAKSNSPVVQRGHHQK